MPTLAGRMDPLANIRNITMQGPEHGSLTADVNGWESGFTWVAEPHADGLRVVVSDDGINYRRMHEQDERIIIATLGEERARTLQTEAGYLWVPALRRDGSRRSIFDRASPQWDAQGRTIRQPRSRRDNAQPEWMTISQREQEAVTRQSGPRVPGNWYWDYRIRSLPVNHADAIEANHFTVTPYLPIDLQAIHYRPRGIFIVRDGITHLVQRIGGEAYTIDTFVDEAKRVGVSRRMPRRSDIPWNQLTIDSRLILCGRHGENAEWHIFMCLPFDHFSFIKAANQELNETQLQEAEEGLETNSWIRLVER